MIKTFATMFSGGGGWDCGAIAAGLIPLWGIEYDEKIAGVYLANFGNHVIVDKVQNVDPARLVRPDVLFMSPPCPNFSNAKVGAEETVMDIEMATACVKFITALKPEVVFLENVRGYLNSKSFRMIRAALDNSGYWTDAQVVNSADFGVPQTRERLILRAHLGGLWSVPALPEPVKWVGWYEAIKDLIPTLEVSKFSDWQLTRLTEEAYTNAFVLDRVLGSNSTLLTLRYGNEPIFTMTATLYKDTLKAWLGHGRVVKFNTRALARFQSFPDSYILPENKALACKVIGNAVPPKLAEVLVRQFVEMLSEQAA